MGLQPARLKQENNRSLLYMHRFCKVVTSERQEPDRHRRLYMHRFCKVVTSVTVVQTTAQLLYMHRFCKVVTSDGYGRDVRH